MTTLTTTPRADGFRMPAEWEPHARTWMIWPERPDNWRLGARPAQAAFATVAEAIAGFEPVTVCVSGGQFESARARLDHPDIRLVEMTTDDAWVRDTGPTFVISAGGKVRGVDWTFNAWGGFDGGLYRSWQRDDQVARRILEIEACVRYRTEGFVLEGGSIHVDGEGTLLTTEECLLNRNRNPRLTREQIQALLAWTDDPEDPNHPRCQAAMRVLDGVRDARGRQLVVHKVPIPGPLHATAEECAGVERVDGSRERSPAMRLAGSYVNFLIVNGGIIAPRFDDARDAEAEAILRRVFPERRVVMLPGREILLGGGSIHCITQQQPASP